LVCREDCEKGARKGGKKVGPKRFVPCSASNAYSGARATVMRKKIENADSEQLERWLSRLLAGEELQDVLEGSGP
jgi:hypothetical protein